MSIYKNLDEMRFMAVHLAKEHNCNYNIILFNPVNDLFDASVSTYEMVTDSYFEKERSNVILLEKTDDIIAEESDRSVDIENIIASNRSIFEPEPIYIKNRYIDFSKQPMHNDIIFKRQYPHVREQKKIGRNELCSCGSKKKFKKCCK
jgi:hypothetical protein